MPPGVTSHQGQRTHPRHAVDRNSASDLETRKTALPARSEQPRSAGLQLRAGIDAAAQIGFSQAFDFPGFMAEAVCVREATQAAPGALFSSHRKVSYSERYPLERPCFQGSPGHSTRSGAGIP